MGAIFKKEIKNYFLSPIGYVFLSIFFAISGLLFFLNIIRVGVADVSGFFSSLFLTIIFSMPILTMGIFSEEYKLYTDRLLFSSPVTNIGIVFGKYFSAVVMYSIACSINLIYVLVISFFAQLQINLVVGCMVGTLFMGFSLVAVGVFVSSLTKNQVIAAFGSFGVLTLFVLIEGFSKHVPFRWAKEVLSEFSLMPRYNNFVMGILNISDILYFLSIILIFIFLTIVVLEKKRWS